MNNMLTRFISYDRGDISVNDGTDLFRSGCA